MITEAGIKSAIRSAPTSGKKVLELKDGGPRGEGRLTLVIRVGASRVSSDWYATWYEGKRRSMVKMGGYPTMGLGEARKAFSAEYSPIIAKGEKPMGPRSRRDRTGITVVDLFEAYVESIKARGSPSWQIIERTLLTAKDNAAKAMGPTKRAADIVPGDIIPHLAGIYGRGSPGHGSLFQGIHKRSVRLRHGVGKQLHKGWRGRRLGRQEQSGRSNPARQGFRACRSALP